MKGLLTSLITVLTFTGLQAQSLPTAPKLVVGLTIDQLRTDYLEAFSSLYGEKGFKRLWKEGRVFRNAQYTFSNIDRSSAIAAIYSGTSPSMNGIIANQWMDASTLRPVNSTDDSAFMGYYTDYASSPSKLLTSTIADELKIATQGKAEVYAIAPFCDAAIFAAGHAANGAFWLNPNTGKWSGSTYYGEFPWWANQYNDRQAIDFRISGITWEPVYPRGMYTFLPDWRDIVFKYKFDDDRKNKFRRFITSPFVNDEVNALTEELLSKGTLGMDDITDLLSLTFYAGNYAHKSPQECAMEIQDTYVRLDRSIASLLELIDKKVGLQNVLFFITSTGYTDSESADSGLYKIPTGEFHLNRCAALLNMFLMATYGEGTYVEAHFDQQIYLNHKLLEKKQLNLIDVQEKAAEFLIQFSGVNEVYSANRLLLGAWTPEIYKIRNSYHRKRSGDLIIDVLPGWTIVNENGQENKVVRSAYIPSPLIFIGHSVKPAIIQTPITIDHIAPTLAHFMRIRAPNACPTSPITDIR
ncbi:alkaline phosphatase family protein [Bacteroides reticulotermitis]|uniref:Alkaline phosphatase n=2 Tax=Bacteroides reticulotermitis TaxID=1133319 RepID=W4UPR6_9BACE|nr:alkaline phosphatase family protein [Bacteroides reticulotermitis]MBB4044540.1 hypothetical protein [Bacteroides reticulotermitis]GAE82489.1 alkaline phosphatase [Bacteroides reticulotermitis JCM 10512]HJD75673.1 alkaline phosphatase family protein [Bacteroides reticulotermitis]